MFTAGAGPCGPRGSFQNQPRSVSVLIKLPHCRPTWEKALCAILGTDPAVLGSAGSHLQKYTGVLWAAVRFLHKTAARFAWALLPDLLVQLVLLKVIISYPSANLSSGDIFHFLLALRCA